jgi:hypothetical protein
VDRASVGMLVEEHSVVLHRPVEDTAQEGTWVVADRLVANTRVEEEYTQAAGTPMVGLDTAGLLNKVNQVWGAVRPVAESHFDFASHPF